MSHTAEVKTALKDSAAIQESCRALGLTCKVGRQVVQMYDGKSVTCDVSVLLPNWNYPVAIDTQTGVASYDNYNGKWGDIAQFDALHQEYTLQVAEREPDVQEYLRQGWQMMREKQENGDVQLVLLKH